MIRPHVIFAVLLLSIASYGQTEMRLERGVDPTSVDGIHSAGTFTADGYSNRTLGFSIKAPAGFRRVDDKTNQEALKTGREITKEGKSAATVKELDRSVAKTRVLFQYHGGGASLAAGIESVPAGTTGREYADANISVLRGVSRTTVSKPVSERALAGRTWQVFEVELRANDGGLVSQVYLMRIEGRTALFLIGSIGDPAMESALIDSLNSLKFK